MNNPHVQRAISFIIDLLIVAILIIFIDNFFSDFFTDRQFELRGFRMKINLSFQYMLYLPYFLVFDLLNRGNSPGKQIIGLHVCNKDGEFIDSLRAVLRTMVKTISISVLPLSMIIFLLFNGYTLHDALLSTKVEQSNK